MLLCPNFFGSFQKVSKMNIKQIKTSQAVTQTNWIEWKTKKHIDGKLTFIAEESGDTVFIHGSNTESIGGKVLAKHFIVQIFIGPRGGINKISVY